MPPPPPPPPPPPALYPPAPHPPSRSICIAGKVRLCWNRSAHLRQWRSRHLLRLLLHVCPPTANSCAFFNDSGVQEAPADVVFELFCAMLRHHYLRHHARSVFHIRVQVAPCTAPFPTPHLSMLQRPARGHIHRQRHERAHTRNSHAQHRAGRQLDFGAVHIIDGVPVCFTART